MDNTEARGKNVNQGPGDIDRVTRESCKVRTVSEGLLTFAPGGESDQMLKVGN